MRIGLVSPYSFDVPGGVQLHVRELAEVFIGQGHDVAVLAPSEDDVAMPSYFTSAGRAVPVRYNGSVARLAFGPMTAARVNRWLERGRFDVLHVHEPASPSVSMLALWATESPVVATFHTATERSRAMLAASPVLRPGMEKIAGRIAVSQEARRTVMRHFGGDAVVIPNGVHVGRFAQAPPKPQWQGTTERPTLAFLGRMNEPRKGLEVLLRAMPAVLRDRPGTRLLVAGPGELSEVERLVPDAVRPACEFLGLISDDDKAALFASADAYIAPNTGGESFGIILVEAMAAGAPVIASDLDAFARVLDEGAAGRLFDTGDPTDLARKISALLADGDARDELSRRGHEQAERFDWGRVAHRIMSVYETVCSAHQPQRRVRDLWRG